jgi:hypothetical protein
MAYKILADMVVLIHLIWIVFLFFGAIWGIKNKGIMIFHISSLVFVLPIQIFDWYCPLTHLEVWLRSKHDAAISYTGSFIIHYVERIVYIELSRHLILILTLFLCGFNAWFYLRRRRY